MAVMAAPPPHSAKAKSFASLLQKPENSSLPIRLPSSYKGKPEVCITEDEQQLLCKKMPFVIAGKFSHGKPPIASIRSEFIKLGMRGRYNVSVLDAKHLILEFDLEEDYTSLFVKKTMRIGLHTMRLIKWTSEFYPGIEPPIVPIWISFPLLPLYWFDKEALFLAASLVGRPLRIDEPTIQRKRLRVARVCVEVDVSKTLPDEVWLTIVDNVTKLLSGNTV